MNIFNTCTLSLFFFHRPITGFKFWGVVSQKIYSVSSEQQLGRQALRPSKRPWALRWEPHASGSESTDFEQQPPARRSNSETSVLWEIRGMHTELATAIDNVRRQLPRELHRHLGESLSCCICYDITLTIISHGSILLQRPQSQYFLQEGTNPTHMLY